jgi:UDP-GlcNAc:undecaprenyl-phosphate/decaprenyl-phosphate GlcNAc-1-phosphate transferase
MTNGSFTSLVLAFAGALVAALALTPIARFVARSLRIVDCPDGKRKLQSRPTALLGGVAVLIALAFGIAGAAHFEVPGTFSQRCCTVVSFCFLCAAGAWDDIWNLRARWKLLAQLLAALPLVFGVLNVESVQLLGMRLDLGGFGAIFALLWLIAAINAMNLIDGMDGLASTAGICSAVSISVVAWSTGHVACAPLAMALAGALCGFLYFNRPPASIYLGDAGSMVIGLTLAALSLRSATLPTGEVAVAPLFAVLGLPLVDMALAIVRRWLSGHGISQPDRLHVHHRLLDAGFRVPQILALISAICLSLGAFAVLGATTGFDWAVLLGIGLFMTAILRMRLIGHHEWLLAKRWLAVRFQSSSIEIAPTEASIRPLRIHGQPPVPRGLDSATSEERRAA